MRISLAGSSFPVGRGFAYTADVDASVRSHDRPFQICHIRARLRSFPSLHTNNEGPCCAIPFVFPKFASSLKDDSPRICLSVSKCNLAPPPVVMDSHSTLAVQKMLYGRASFSSRFLHGLVLVSGLFSSSLELSGSISTNHFNTRHSLSTQNVPSALS